MRTSRRRAAPPRSLLALVLATVALLAGCINVKADLSVAADDTITGTMVISMSKDLATMAGITSLDQLNEQLKGSEVPEGLEVSTSEDDADFHVTLTGDLGNTDGLFTATTSGTTQTFTVTNNQAQSASPTPSPDPSADKAYRMVITARFAGTVTKVSGEGASQVDANTVTFTGPVMSPWKASATVDLSKPVAGGGAPAGTQASTPPSGLAIAAGAVALIGLVAVGTLLLLRRRRRTSPAPVGAPPAPQVREEPEPGAEEPGEA